MASEPLSIVGLSQATKLPAAWLRAEALAGRLPCLEVGRRLLFDLDAVKKALSARAAAGKAERVDA